MSLEFYLAVGVTTVIVSAAVVGLVYYTTYAVYSQWLGATVWHGRQDAQAVALTFDDGPSEDTERVLDVLQAYGVRATFFMIGREVERHQRTARRIVSEGHEVGNHSYSHPIYLYRTRRETERQLALTQQVIASMTGVRPQLARPPCGVRTPAYFAAARRLGLRTVQWSVAGFDWKRRSARQIAGAALKDARPGSIILLHDGDSEGKRDRRETVAALPLIIEGLRARGLRVAPLTQLLEAESEEGRVTREIVYD